MPFELGLFLGATKFGTFDFRKKYTLIFDREEFRYQAFISDIAGQDIHTHEGSIDVLIYKIATWLRDRGDAPHVPGGLAIASEFASFSSDLPTLAATRRLQDSEITFRDYWTLAQAWIWATASAAV
jgi:hypothetical protein